MLRFARRGFRVVGITIWLVLEGTLMAVDRTKQKFHLTPKGWVRGPLTTMFDTTSNETPPTDRVLTITVSTVQTSRFSPDEKSVKETWRGTATDEEIEDLKKKFPAPPDIED